jgi:alanine racemase
LNNWIEVSADRLTANFRTLQRVVGSDITILAVIKANAYGHGAEVCAPILVRAGARWLGVTCATEGVRVRRALLAHTLEAKILVMCGFLPADAPLIAEHRLTPVLWTREQVDWLRPYPGTHVHIEVDTGMGRQGVTPHDFSELLGEVRAAGLVADGLFTHFCSSEVAHSPLTALQQRRFEAIVEQAAQLGLKPAWLHAANTSAVDNPADADWLPSLAARLGARPLVRTGLALYGYTLPIEDGPKPGNNIRHPERSEEPLHFDRTGSTLTALEPILTWKGAVLAVRDLAPGDTVGYNAIFTAPSAMRVALLPVGYADGLHRELSSTNERPGGWVMLHGQRAPILGRISMNLTVVDITQIAQPVHPGDEAILLGEGIDAHAHAALARTIPYEILCGIHPCG